MKQKIVDNTLIRNARDLDKNGKWTRKDTRIRVSYDALKNAVANNVTLGKSDDISLEILAKSLPSMNTAAAK